MSNGCRIQAKNANSIKVRRIESVVTPSGNSGHVVVPKAWIGKEAVVVLKEGKAKQKK